MDYKNLIDPELRKISRNIPYHKGMIKFVNIFQRINFRLTRIPRGIVNRHIMLEGYEGKKFRVEIFEPSEVKENLPELIYVHGGAFSYKASALHKKLACIYAIKAKCRVYLPDYHLTPKYQYPAAYLDVLALYKWIMKNLEKSPICKIGIAGDSAGASIAALICNNYRREWLRQPCLQMLVYPLTDVSMQTDSMKKFVDTPLWNSKNNKRMWLYYSRKFRDRYEASPMYSSSSLSRIIPDTYIETAEYDCLHDEGIIYGKRLQEEGVNVKINETKGTIHGYDLALNSKIVVRNIKKRISFLRKGFYNDLFIK